MCQKKVCKSLAPPPPLQNVTLKTAEVSIDFQSVYVLRNNTTICVHLSTGRGLSWYNLRPDRVFTALTLTQKPSIVRRNWKRITSGKARRKNNEKKRRDFFPGQKSLLFQISNDIRTQSGSGKKTFFCEQIFSSLFLTESDTPKVESFFPHFFIFFSTSLLHFSPFNSLGSCPNRPRRKKNRDDNRQTQTR